MLVWELNVAKERIFLFSFFSFYFSCYCSVFIVYPVAACWSLVFESECNGRLASPALLIFILWAYCSQILWYAALVPLEPMKCVLSSSQIIWKCFFFCFDIPGRAFRLTFPDKLNVKNQQWFLLMAWQRP